MVREPHRAARPQHIFSSSVRSTTEAVELGVELFRSGVLAPKAEAVRREWAVEALDVSAASIRAV